MKTLPYPRNHHFPNNQSGKFPLLTELPSMLPLPSITYQCFDDCSSLTPVRGAKPVGCAMRVGDGARTDASKQKESDVGMGMDQQDCDISALQQD